jgi:hypothetical protein
MNVQFSSSGKIAVRRFSSKGEIDEFVLGRNALEIGDPYQVQESCWLISLSSAESVTELKVFPPLDSRWDICSLGDGFAIGCGGDVAVLFAGRDAFSVELESQFDEFKILQSGECIVCWQSGVGALNPRYAESVFRWTFAAPDLVAGVSEEGEDIVVSIFESEPIAILRSTGEVRAE